MLALALGLLLSPALAQDLDASLQDLLAKHDTAPTQAEFQALGPGVEAELLRIAQDDQTRSSSRARAILAMGWYPSPATQAFLEAALSDTSRASVDRRKASQALATGWGFSELHTQALNDEDVQLRMATVRALAPLDDGQARLAMAARLEVETDEATRQLLEKALIIKEMAP